jgi:hypothetical protein
MSPTAPRTAGVCLLLAGLAILSFGFLHVVTGALIILGLIGFHAQQVRQTGRPGLAGLGLMCLAVLMLATIELAPWLGISLGQAAVPIAVSGGFILAAGGSLLGWATNRGGVYPRATGTGLIAASLMVPVIGGAFFALYLGWMAFLVWSGKAVPPETPAAS